MSIEGPDSRRPVNAPYPFPAPARPPEDPNFISQKPIPILWPHTEMVLLFAPSSPGPSSTSFPSPGTSHRLQFSLPSLFMPILFLFSFSFAFSVRPSLSFLVPSPLKRGYSEHLNMLQFPLLVSFVSFFFSRPLISTN